MSLGVPATAPAAPPNLLTGSLDEASVLVKARDVTKVFGGLVAVNSIDFDIPRGSIVSLIGPNGAGKTTFFNMITGYYTPTLGSISFDGQPIVTQVRAPSRPMPELEAGIKSTDPKVRREALRELSRARVRSRKPHDVTALGIGRTFQNIRLFGTMSALDNVRVGVNVHMKSRWWSSVIRAPSMLREEQATVDEAMALLRLVDLEERAETWARNLPYGDQRRLEIARALATRPKLLLLDEPTAGMNSSETRELTDFIRRLRSEMGLTVLLIEHDMRVVMDISDRVTVLDYGEVIAEGSPEAVRQNPRVIEAYLGRGAAEA